MVFAIYIAKRHPTRLCYAEQPIPNANIIIR